MAQTPVFQYFPVDAMKRRLGFLGRDDQLADLEQRLARDRQHKPQSSLARSLF